MVGSAVWAWAGWLEAIDYKTGRFVSTMGPRGAGLAECDNGIPGHLLLATLREIF